MVQEQSSGTEKENSANKENLEHKITFWDRAKYASIPAALTVGACFIPNIKNGYDGLSKEKKNTYRTVALAGTTLFGTLVAAISGYKLAKSSVTDKHTYVQDTENH